MARNGNGQQKQLDSLRACIAAKCGLTNVRVRQCGPGSRPGRGFERTRRGGSSINGVSKKSQTTGSLSDYGLMGVPLEHVAPRRALDASQAFMHVEAEGSMRCEPEVIIPMFNAPPEAPFNSRTEASEAPVNAAPGAEGVDDYSDELSEGDTDPNEAYAEWGNEGLPEASDEDDMFPESMEDMKMRHGRRRRSGGLSDTASDLESDAAIFDAQAASLEANGQDATTQRNQAAQRRGQAAAIRANPGGAPVVSSGGSSLFGGIFGNQDLGSTLTGGANLAAVLLGQKKQPPQRPELQNGGGGGGGMGWGTYALIGIGALGGVWLLTKALRKKS